MVFRRKFWNGEIYSTIDFGCLTQSLQEGFQESEILNKRTNGAVNAHLRSGIYTNKQDLAIK